MYPTPSTSSHAVSVTMATSALVVVLALTRVKLDDTTLGAATVLVNGTAMSLHPFVMALGARLMAWLAPPAQKVPSA